MAAPSVNVNLSAKIDFNLSISFLFSTDPVVEVSERSIKRPMLTGCNENLALTDTSEANECSENNLESIAEPVQRCPNNEESDSNENTVGPLTAEMLSSLANRFSAFFERPDSSLSCISATLLPSSSPASPSFSDINPDGLFWIPLPEIEMDGDVTVDVMMEDDGVVEIIPCEFDNDDDVVFVKEVKRSGAKRE